MFGIICDSIKIRKLNYNVKLKLKLMKYVGRVIKNKSKYTL